MQKKKPSFQVIPNYSINGVTNWNESKEVPAEQGCIDIGLRNFSGRCTILTRKWCGAIVWLAQSWPGYGSPVH
jgi:hypothetical protein